MAAKAAQLAQWLKELQDKVNADGNIKYDDILLFTKEKSLTSKQLDSVFKALHEGGVEIIYEEDGKDEFRDGESEEEFEDELLEDGDAEADVDEKEWEKGDGDISADPAGITDPVRLYLRECGTTPLLTSEQEMKLAQTIEKISAERIQTELVKMLTSDHPELIREVYTSGISDVILPEFSVLMQTEQNNPHHCYTVGEHTIHVVQQVENQKVLRLAALFHDIAKPVCKTTDETGVDHFYGHPKEGAKMAHRIFRRLKFDVDTMQKVCGLVEWHDDNPNLTPAGIRKAIYRVGEERYPNLFALKRADVLSQSGYRREEKLAYIQSYQKLYEEIIEQKDCLSLKKLAVNGRDLMDLGIKPGKKIGQILQKLLEEVLEEPDKNQKEYLLERVKQTYQ